MADEADLSIDDQRDTATGGLANDTPAMPMSPPPRGAPSALGGLAGAASRQRLFQGAPAAKPLGPGTSPWAAPGQSQINAPPQPNQRWTGTTASLALPRGAMQPPAKFTPFMRGVPTTSIHQWGQIDPTDSLPQPFEAPSLYGNLAKFFGQTGSSAIMPLALSMGKNGAAFINGVMQGQEWKAKMHRQQMLDDAAELEQRQQKEMYTYYDTANEYESAKGVSGATAVGSYAIRGRTLLQAWEEEANKLGDDKFLAVLSTGSVEKALNFLHERNNNWQTLAKTNKSAEKQQEEDNAKDWGVPGNYGDGQGQQSDRNFTFPQQNQQQQPQPNIAGGAPATTLSPLMKPLGQNGDLAPFQQAGLDNFREGKSLNDVPKGPARNASAEYSRGLATQAGDIQRQIRDGKITQDQIPAALDKLIPGMGTDYRQTYRGVHPPSGTTGNTPYWTLIKNLAVPDPIQQDTTIRDFSSTAHGAGARLSAGARMGVAAKNVLEAMKKIPEGETIPYYMADALIANKYTGDPKYAGLFNALQTYIQDAQALQSPTGRFYVTEVESLKRNLQSTSGLRAVRTFLQQDADNSVGLMDQLVREYQHGAQRAGEFPSTFDQKNYDLLSTIKLIDPDRGFEGHSDLPPELQGLGLGAGVEPTTGKTIGAPKPGLPKGWSWQ